MAKNNMELPADTIRFVALSEDAGWITDLDVLSGILGQAGAVGVTTSELAGLLDIDGVDTLGDFEAVFTAFLRGRGSR